MELKVWCDGIQRVVCGVSSSTSCQDVVFALAHATGQTGRFILIEKWRNNERLLAPNEQPLAVLSKWGEYANDVTFIMKRSDSNNKFNNNNNNNSNCNNSSFSNSLTTTSPAAGITGSGISNSPNKKDKKSTSFSSASSPSIIKSTTNTTTTSTISTTTQNSSPLKSNSSLTSSHKTDSNNSTPTKTLPKQQLNNTNNNNDNNNNNNNNEISLTSKSLSSRPRHPPPYLEAISKSAMISSTNTNTSHNSQFIQSPDEKSNKRRSLEPSPQTQKQRTNSQKEQLLQRDALRLVDMQKETMKNQEKEMSSLEQQITTIEKKLSENESTIKIYKDEMEMVHKLWLDQEMMIDKLDQQKLDEELDELVAEAKNYEEEVLIMKKKLSNCEGDIADCRQKIAKLMNKLEESHKCAKLNDLEKEENDRLITDQIKIAIRDKNKELELQKCELQTINNSITHLDTLLNEKNSQIDKLIVDIKEANIEGLALQQVDEVSKLAKQPFHQRSGSTRRIIGSPRQLENAVATNKNPHGVWV